jgi:molybdenum cofactor synthesis domain-containing protein
VANGVVLLIQPSRRPVPFLPSVNADPAIGSPAGSTRSVEPVGHDDHAIPTGTTALVMTVSDGVAAGTRQDDSGTALAEWLTDRGFAVDRAAVSDDRPAIEAGLREAAATHSLVVSTGGTGLTPRDVTPQATLAVIDYQVPGLAEAIRAAGRVKTPMADLSRGVVGVLGGTLIVNVPGSPRAALECIEALSPTLQHALETLGGPFDHGAAGAGHEGRPDLPDPAR